MELQLVFALETQSMCFLKKVDPHLMISSFTVTKLLSVVGAFEPD